MSLCPKCKNKLEENARFCANCGIAIIAQPMRKWFSPKNLFLNLFLSIVILNGLVGMLGIAIASMQLQVVFASLDNAGWQLNQIGTGVPQDFSKNFGDMASNLRNTANSLNNICAAQVIGFCLYKVDLSGPSGNLKDVANNIENVPRTLQLEQITRFTSNIANAMPMVKMSIVAVLGYLFIQHFSFFAIGIYLINGRCGK